jgi:hypothetical protein
LVQVILSWHDYETDEAKEIRLRMEPEMLPHIGDDVEFDSEPDGDVMYHVIDRAFVVDDTTGAEIPPVTVVLGVRPWDGVNEPVTWEV